LESVGCLASPTSKGWTRIDDVGNAAGGFDGPVAYCAEQCLALGFRLLPWSAR